MTLLLLFGWLMQDFAAFSPADHLTPGMEWPEAFEVYYRPSPDEFVGWATRYGPDEAAIAELRWYALEIAAQVEHAGYALIGGGYGFHEIAGQEYLLESRASEGFGLMVTQPDMARPALTEQQARLLYLAGLSEAEFNARITSSYIGVISLKSPNDIGRVFCLLRLGEITAPVGLVIVGGTASRNDWTYYGESVNDAYGHPRLGTRVAYAPDGTMFWWAADLMDSVYYAAGGDGGAAFVAFADPAVCER